MSLATFSGARLRIFIPPQFSYDGSAPPWESVHVGEFTIPPHKPVHLEPSDTVPPAGVEHSYAEHVNPHKTVSANPAKFDPDSYTMGADKFIPVPRIGMPKAPQPPPVPRPNADLYQEFHLPSLLRRMTAKTREGQRRFHEWRKSTFRQRNALYATGEQLLREADFEGDYADRRNHCAQCGGSFFERKGEKLRCRDCRWELNEVKYFDPQDRFDSPTINDRFGVTISNEGQRETNALRPHDHQERKVWFPKWEARFNPEGKKWAGVTTADVEAVKGDPDFSTEVSRYRVMFLGERISEIAKGSSNTLTKQLSRTRELPTWEQEFFQDIQVALEKNRADEFAIVIYLNKRAEVKTLGTVNDSYAKLHRSLVKQHKATVKARLRALRRMARANGWTERMLAVEIREAEERIETAYRLPLAMLSEGEGTAITFSHKDRGETA